MSRGQKLLLRRRKYYDILIAADVQPATAMAQLLYALATARDLRSALRHELDIVHGDALAADLPSP